MAEVGRPRVPVADHAGSGSAKAPQPPRRLGRTPFRFCPYCAAELVPRLIEDRSWPACPACGFVAATGQKLAAGAVVIHRGRVLLLQRRLPPVGAWELPGGYVDRGETPWDAARREMHEEAGIALAAGALLGVFTDERATAVCYQAEARDRTVVLSGSHAAAAFFSPHEIPWGRLRSANHRAALCAWLRANPPVVVIAGHSGSGKTTLIEEVVRLLAGRGLKIAAIKHDPKGHASYDCPGKDSHRFRQGGATAVGLSGPATLAFFHQVDRDRPLADLVRELTAVQPIDLVLAEGYAAETRFSKVEVYRPALGRRPRCAARELTAVITDAAPPVPGLQSVPHLPLDDPEAVAGFLLQTALQAGCAAEMPHPDARANLPGTHHGL